MLRGKAGESYVLLVSSMQPTGTSIQSKRRTKNNPLSSHENFKSFSLSQFTLVTHRQPLPPTCCCVLNLNLILKCFQTRRHHISSLKFLMHGMCVWVCGCQGAKEGTRVCLVEIRKEVELIWGKGPSMGKGFSCTEYINLTIYGIRTYFTFSSRKDESLL